MKITIRPDPDCIDLIRSEFKDMIIVFLNSIGIPAKDGEQSRLENMILLEDDERLEDVKYSQERSLILLQEWFLPTGHEKWDLIKESEKWDSIHTIELNEKIPPLIDVFHMKKCFLPEELFTKPEWVFEFTKEEHFNSFVISGHVICCYLLSTEGLKSLPKKLFNLSCGFEVEALNEFSQELNCLQSLKSISFKYCKNLRDISLLESLVNLQVLNLSRCLSLTDISGLSELVNLEFLRLSDCRSLTDIRSLARLSNLQSLNLSYCSSLTDISGLSELVNLEFLRLSDCRSLTDISSLSELVKLKVFDFESCESLTDISSLSKLVKLQVLNLSGCESLTDISGLSELVNLEFLRLSDCRSLTDIRSLTGLSNLQFLDLSLCKLLKNISSLAGLLNLQTLDLNSCESLTDISSLACLLNLQALDLGWCKLLADISRLFKLVNLQFLKLGECKRIQNWFALRNCLALKGLEESKMHPAEYAELLCFLAVQRKDIPVISVKTNYWLKELELGFSQNHSHTYDLACSLAKGIILANLDEVGLSFHQTLLNHPNVSLAPWKIWFSENLNTFGWNKIQKLAELNKPNELTFGAIGGISSCLPSMGSDPAQIAWAKKWISKIHSLHNNNPNFLKPAAAELCLALKRLGEDELLTEWIEKFTDPSDPSALDHIYKVFSAYALDLNDSESALEYAFKINDPKLRDESILNLAQQFIKEGETTKAGEFLFLLTQIESRTQLAYSLAEDAAYLKNDENAHRLLAACGDNPQSLASILDKLRLANPDSEILKIKHKKQSDESVSQVPASLIIQESNIYTNTLLKIKDPSQLVRVQQVIESVMKSS